MAPEGGVKRKLTKDKLKDTKLWREIFAASDEEAENNFESKTEDVQAQKRRKAHVPAESESARESVEQDKEKDTAATKKEFSRKKRKVTIAEETSNEKQGLSDVIKYHPKLISAAAKNWLDRYENEPETATCELLLSVFETCGVSYQTDEGELLQESVDEVVTKLVEQAKQGEVEDYISSKQKELRGFKDNLTAFWAAFVFECRTGPLFDEKLMEKLMGFITMLACTQPRNFRHVATLIGLQLVTSFIDVAKNLCQSRETKQRQLNAEKRKRKEGPRVESLSKVLSETHEKITKLEEMMRQIFRGLFMHRYRDIDPDIRVACIRAIGSWILSYPSLFLQDLYLKYLGWTLNDKNAGVRKASVDSLQALYENDDNIPSLKLFSTRFSARILELANDVDVGVAVSGIGLLRQFLRHQRTGDTESLDIGPVYDLLIDESPQIRHAVGQLVYEQVIAQPGSDEDDSDKSKLQLKKLLNILRDFVKDPILSTHVIDAIWDEMKAMQDWQCLTSMLLDDSQEVEEVDAANLCRILCASARKATGGKMVFMGDNRKANVLSKAQKEAFESNKKKLTTVMIKDHARLLRKFVADASKVPYIVEVLQCLNLELYSLKQKKENGVLSLELVKEAFFKHGDGRTLKACVQTLAFCSNEGDGELPVATQRILKETCDDVISKLRAGIQQAGETEDDYSLTVNLRRLQHLQLSVPVPNEGVFKNLVAILEDFSELDDEVVQLILVNMFLHVLWTMKGLDYENPDENQMESLQSKRSTLLKYLDLYTESIITSFKEGSAEPRHSLCCTICTVLSDLYTLFHEEKLSSTKLERLGFSPSLEAAKKFWDVCQYRLLAADTEQDVEEVPENELECVNQKDLVMTAAAKLIAHNVVPKDFLVSEIVSHYVLHGKAVDETLKQLLLLLKKSMKSLELCSMHLEAMQKAYQRFLDEKDEKRKAQLLEATKELSIRLSATFSGVARNIHKASLLKTVKNGIEYAFQNFDKQQLGFLEVCVLPFCQRLAVADIRDIIENVNSKAQGTNLDEEQPYVNFLEQLQDRVTKTEAPAKKKRNRNGRAKQDKDDEDDEDVTPPSDEEDEIEDDDDDDTPLYVVRGRAKAAASASKEESSHSMRTRNKTTVARFSAPATEEQLPE